MAFPLNPTVGDRHYTHTQTWEWDGVDWVQEFGVDDSAVLRVNPDEPVPGGLDSMVGSATDGWWDPQWVGVSRISAVNVAAIGGVPIQVDQPNDYELLQYRAGAWRNTPQTEVTDGGNF